MPHGTSLTENRPHIEGGNQECCQVEATQPNCTLWSLVYCFSTYLQCTVNCTKAGVQLYVDIKWIQRFQRCFFQKTKTWCAMAIDICWGKYWRNNRIEMMDAVSDVTILNLFNYLMVACGSYLVLSSVSILGIVNIACNFETRLMQ